MPSRHVGPVSDGCQKGIALILGQPIMRDDRVFCSSPGAGQVRRRSNPAIHRGVAASAAMHHRAYSIPYNRIDYGIDTAVQ